MNTYERTVYPFTAIVGQDKMKKALILNVINPRIGGILIRGEKGTAKSTAVRALAALLPEMNVVAGCSCNCDPDDSSNLCYECSEKLKAGHELERKVRKVPVVELPVSTTEDRMVGTLDFQYAIKHGKCKFEPGLLAEANRGIVYVDEVNLLDDHMVDVLLDAAAMGVNIVERENVSCCHPSKFVLVGTMNPEEGDMRPQLLDRFGLCVEVQGESDLAKRVEIIKKRDEFDSNPVAFMDNYAFKQRQLKEKIMRAREILPEVVVSEEMLALITRLCVEACVAGHRADLVMDETCRTIAAWHGRHHVTPEDAYEAAELVLLHRMRDQDQLQDDKSQSSDEGKDNDKQDEDEEKEEDESKQQPEDQQLEKSSEQMQGGSENHDVERNQDDEEQKENNASKSNGELQVVFSIGESFQVKRMTSNKDRILRKGPGRRSNTKTASKAGRYICSTMHGDGIDLALDATLRAAAPYQLYRSHEQVAVAIESSDIRNKLREKRIGNFLLFVVDASGSMGAQQRMVETKGAVMSLLLDAYQKRDKIGMIAFRGKTAELILPPTNSVELAHKLLEEMPTGGKTPLSAALDKAYLLCEAELRKDENISPLLILISDGRGNVSMGEGKPFDEAAGIAEIIGEESRIKSLVIDVEKKSFISFGLAGKLAGKLGAECYRIDDLKADTLVQAVRKQME